MTDAGGRKRDRDHAADEEFRCGVCLDTYGADDYIMCSNGHIFCHSCHSNTMKMIRVLCPECKCPFKEEHQKTFFRMIGIEQKTCYACPHPGCDHCAIGIDAIKHALLHLEHLCVVGTYWISDTGKDSESGARQLRIDGNGTVFGTKLDGDAPVLTKHTGVVEDGQFVRYGVYDENHVRVYEGWWLNHKRHGSGKEFNSNGRTIYDGKFENGERHGAGTSYHARPYHPEDEIEQTGYWKNGELVKGECHDVEGNCIKLS